MNRRKMVLVGLAGFGALVGCRSREPIAVQPVPDLTTQLEAEFKAKAPEPPDAGVKRDLKPHTIPQIVESAGLSFLTRKNPFAMFGEELGFETAIRTRIILGKHTPTYATEFDPPVEEIPEELRPVEPQPYRRIAGIYFGDTVAAIIEMEDGRTYVVAPGQQIPGSEWIVESVDTEKAILRRDPRKRPDRIIVRLESRPSIPGGGGGGTGGGGGGTGGQPGGVGGGGVGSPSID